LSDAAVSKVVNAVKNAGINIEDLRRRVQSGELSMKDAGRIITNILHADRSDLSLHPTVKPVAMVEDAILDCSNRKGIVLDPFVGSGTTLIAAEKTGRRGCAIEIDPQYCDVTIRRLRAVCGLQAVLEATGETFEEIASGRRRDVA
jgi:DNA modification methylase